MRILLCDDDPAILSQMERLLKEFFHEYGLSQPEIAGYTGGEKLLNSQDTGEIAFLDVEMPGLSGIHTGERLKKRSHSAYSQESCGGFDKNSRSEANFANPA